MDLKTAKVRKHVLRRWTVLAWNGNPAFNSTFHTRKEARAAKAFDDQQVVRATIVLGPHRRKA